MGGAPLQGDNNSVDGATGTEAMGNEGERGGEVPATPVADGGRNPMAAPSKNQDNFALATWNVRSGRPGGTMGGIEAAARALDSLNVDIAVLQETKVRGGLHPQHQRLQDLRHQRPQCQARGSRSRVAG